LKATRNIRGKLVPSSPFRVYIGWDAREPDAFEVARFSLERRSSIPVSVVPIKQGDLRVPMATGERLFSIPGRRAKILSTGSTSTVQPGSP
jgi:hypothetical protein